MNVYSLFFKKVKQRRVEKMFQLQWYLDNRPTGYQNRKSVIHYPAAPLTGWLISGQKTVIHKFDHPYNRLTHKPTKNAPITSKNAPIASKNVPITSQIWPVIGAFWLNIGTLSANYRGSLKQPLLLATICPIIGVFWPDIGPLLAGYRGSFRPKSAPITSQNTPITGQILVSYVDCLNQPAESLITGQNIGRLKGNTR